MRPLAATIAVLLLVCTIIDAQTRPSGDERFDAASIKAATQVDASPGLVVYPDRFVATGAILADLLRYAYGFNSLTSQSQVIGGPAWVTTTRFDIVAKSNGQPTLGMLKTLLEERFALATHIERRETSIYALVLDRQDRRLGPALRPSTSECESGGVPAPQTSAQATPRCGIRGRPGSYTGEGMSMAQFVRVLGNFPAIGRVVVDRTALDGRFDWTLEWTPTFNTGPTGGAALVPNPNADQGGSIFTALREQLGVRLEADTASIEVLVIDHAELPTPD